MADSLPWSGRTRQPDIARPRAGAGVPKEHGIGVQADDPAGYSNPGAQEVSDPARATAEIKASPAGPDTDAVQHRLCIKDQGAALRV